MMIVNANKLLKHNVVMNVERIVLSTNNKVFGSLPNVREERSYFTSPRPDTRE